MGNTTVFIVDGNNLDVRMRLTHAIKATTGFGHCEYAATCRDAIARLENIQHKIDLIFISYHFSQDQVKEFAIASRGISTGEDAAMVMILPAGFTKGDALADTALAGVDGFLIEPYSCDDLVRMANLAAKVKKDRAASREQMAIQFIVKDVIRLIDTLYCLHRNGLDMNDTFQKLRDTCAKVRTFEQDAQQAYLARLVEMCERSLVPIPVPPIGYRAKSARARKKVEQMLASELAAPKPKLDRKKFVMVDGKVMKLPPLKP